MERGSQQLPVWIAVKLSKFFPQPELYSKSHQLTLQDGPGWMSPVPPRPCPSQRTGEQLDGAVAGRGAGVSPPAGCRRSWNSAWVTGHRRRDFRKYSFSLTAFLFILRKKSPVSEAVCLKKCSEVRAVWCGSKLQQILKQASEIWVLSPLIHWKPKEISNPHTG